MSDTEIPTRYYLIDQNYDEIIGLLHDENYDMIYKLIGRNPENIVGTNMSKGNSLNLLLQYCMYKTDTNILKVMHMNNLFDEHLMKMFMSMGPITKNYDIYKFCMDNIMTYEFVEKYMDTLVSHIRGYTKEKFKFLKVIIDRGHKFNIQSMKSIIMSYNIESLQYLIENDYDVQGCYNDMGNYVLLFDYDILKFLDTNIDITKYIINIYYSLINSSNIKALTYLVDNFPELNLKNGLNLSCVYNKIESIKYFLNKGCDITDILIDNTTYIKFPTLKFLIDCGYPTKSLNLDRQLSRVFIDDSHLDNVYYLIQNGASIEAFINDVGAPTQNNFEVSSLETIIMKGKYNHVKFLVENYYDYIQQKLNNMFIIACANGRVDIAKYLLNFDAEMNVKSLMVACYNGHYEIVLMLLDLGLDFGDVDENLFDIVIDRFMINQPSKIHPRIINRDIFKNNNFYYGDDKKKIIELLMKYNVPVGNCEFVPKISYQYCTIDFFRYIVERIDDPNKEFDGMTLLDMSIMLNNKDVSDMLINEYGVKTDDDCL